MYNAFEVLLSNWTWPSRSCELQKGTNMPVELKEKCEGWILEVHATGKLTTCDYLQLVPVFDRLNKQHPKLRILFELQDFHGWTDGALWEDIKFELKHFSDIERLAIVGEAKWEKGMATFCKPFTTASIRYFDQSKVAAARAWLSEEELLVKKGGPATQKTGLAWISREGFIPKKPPKPGHAPD